MAARRPSEVVIFTYQVGFGDCFLLRFVYASMARHVLIDFGTMGLPESAESGHMLRIANDIADKCGGKLDIVVATHRHADHISGFATNNGTASGDIIASLAKDAVVLQPWTEAPDLAVDAVGPLPDDHQGFAARRASLAAMQGFAAELVAALAAKPPRGLSKAALDQLAFIGRDNIANLSAVENLMAMGKQRIYAYHGLAVDLRNVLPGIKLRVLGPPTLKQTATIRKQRASDADEFWQLAPQRLAAEAALGTGSDELFPGHPYARATRLPMEARWFARRVEAAAGDQKLALVRVLDKAMNNTSLILLFEARGKKLLFPGDAQIENWNFALAQPDIKALLAGVDLYKVGHHGSRNATPMSLWNGFANRGGRTKKGRMTSLLSTMPGKHGSADEGARSEVPRTTLLKALTDDTHLHSTHTLPPDTLFEEVRIKLA